MAAAGRLSAGHERTAKATNRREIETLNMKPQQYFALMAVTMLPLVAALAQSTNSIALQPTSSSLSPAAAEVAKLAQSRVGDDVMLAFIEQSRSYYNLSADHITALKSAGV